MSIAHNNCNSCVGVKILFHGKVENDLFVMLFISLNDKDLLVDLAVTLLVHPNSRALNTAG